MYKKGEVGKWKKIITDETIDVSDKIYTVSVANLKE